MGRVATIILICITGLISQAQDTAFRITYKQKLIGEFTDFAVDNLSNIYLVTATNQIKKYNNKGDSVAVFNDQKKYGKIFSIDVTNPFKVLVYYKEFSTILVLDRFLSVVNTIDLRKQNISDAKAVGLSYDNNIWIYDELASKIRKIDDNGKQLLESTDLRMVFEEVPAPTFIIDNKKSLYLYDPKRGWLVFDYYGGYQNKFAFTNWKDVQVINDNLTGREENCILVSKPKELAFTKKRCLVPLINAVKIQHSLKHTYILFAERLEIYDAP
jgi:hypothetical protein